MAPTSQQPNPSHHHTAPPYPPTPPSPRQPTPSNYNLITSHHTTKGEFYTIDFFDGDTHDVTKHELLYWYERDYIKDLERLSTKDSAVDSKLANKHWELHSSLLK